VILNSSKLSIKKKQPRQGLMPVSLATREAETRRVIVQSQQGQIVLEIPSQWLSMVAWGNTNRRTTVQASLGIN
jgi:hypothetical protein